MRTIDDELAAKRAEGKPRLDLVPYSIIEAIARQLEYGAAKHGLHDWRKGLPWTYRYASILRHLFAWGQGEDIDPESKRPHLDAAATQLGILIEYRNTHPELDDRWKRQHTGSDNGGQTVDTGRIDLVEKAGDERSSSG
jgi:hypothetical protein